MDYKNILEGARPFFQGLPSPLQNAAPGTPLPLLPLAIPSSHIIQQENSVIRTKFEEGLGATLSQMYGTGPPASLRNSPAASAALSPKTNSTTNCVVRIPTPNLHLRSGTPAVGLVGSSTSAHNNTSLVHAAGPSAGGVVGSGSVQPNMVVRRESPLDLSVKTVRQSADSSTSLTSVELATGNSSSRNSSGSASTPTPLLNNNNNKSLSSSGASTPNNSHNTATINNTSVGSNHVSSVIAAVVNSTTSGREREYESTKAPQPSPLAKHSSPSQQQQQQQQPAHELANHAPSSQPPPGFTTPNHHLFGHYPAHSPAGSASQNVAAGKAYHQYLTQGSAAAAAGAGRTYPTSGVAVPTSSANSQSSSTPGASHQQQQRPSSVIPPYNPPTPNFGVYHQQAGSHGPIHSAFHHHPHSPYSPYHHPHIQQAQQHQQQVHHQNAAAYYHNPYAHSAPQNNPPTSSSSNSANNANLNGAANNSEQYLRSPAAPNQAHQQSQYHQPTASNKEQQQQQAIHSHHYGLPPSSVPPAASSYHHYPQYVPQHLVQNSSPHLSNHQATPSPASNNSTSNHQQPPQHQNQAPSSMPGAQSQQIQPHQYHPGYPNSHMPPQSRYGSPQQQPRYPAPSHVPSPYPYHQQQQQQQQQQIPPRGIAAVTPQHQPSPTNNYTPSPLYPPHLAGPRQQTPPTSQSPQSGKQKKTVAASAAKVVNENSNTSSNNSGNTTTAHRSSQGSKPGGSSRKNLLNLLRNSLESRIHEKQEKEKFQFNHQTWNFHGRKITLPPPPGAVAAAKPGDVLNGGSMNPAGSGSILTGLSHNSGTTASIGLNGTSIPNLYPDIFGISQRNSHNPSSIDDESRAMTFHGSQELSPGTAESLMSSMSRIRTKAEKKQLFPNLLSQIEQENSNKLHPGLIPMDTVHYGKSGQPKSVFDFEDEEDDTKLKLNRSNSMGNGNSVGNSHNNSGGTIRVGSTPHGSSTPPARKSGSKKFTSKLTKAKDFFNSTSTLSSSAINTINDVAASASQYYASTLLATGTTKDFLGPSTSSGLDSKVVAAAAAVVSFSTEPLDTFWAACDSFVDDLTANPTSIKSKRGGLWAKLKSQQQSSKDKDKSNNNLESKPSSRRGGSTKRVRRNSSEEDEDFEIDAKSDEVEDDEEDEENSNDDDTSHSQDSSDDDPEVDQVGLSDKVSKKKVGVGGDEEDDEDSSTSVAKKTKTGSKRNSLTGTKRKASLQNFGSSPSKKDKKSNSSANNAKDKNSKQNPKIAKTGIKVGNHTLRERRATSTTTSNTHNLLIAKSVSDLDEDATSRSSIGSVSDDDSDANESYSISDDLDNSDSDDSDVSNSDDTNSDSSETSDDDESDDEVRAGSESSGAESGVVGKRKTKATGGSNKGKGSPTAKRKSSTKGGRGGGRNKKSGKSSKKRRKARLDKKNGKKRRSLRSGRGGGDEEAAAAAVKKTARKLRPKRNCAKDNLKDASGAESVEGKAGGGSSGEEWIMRGELTKKKSRIVFGDGSDFRRPGWEEELIDFKKKLRMPSKLIRVGKPSSHASSPSGIVKDIKDEPSTTVNSPAKSTKENKSPSKATDDVTSKAKGRPLKGASKDKVVAVAVAAVEVKTGKKAAGKGCGKSDKKPEVDPVDEPEVEKSVVEKMKAAAKKSVSLLNKHSDKVSEASAHEDQPKTTPAKGGVKVTTPQKRKGSSSTPAPTPPKNAKNSKESSSTKGTPSKESAKSIPTKDSKGNKDDAKSNVSKDSSASTIPAKDTKNEKDPQLLPTPGPAGLKFNKKMSIKSVFGVDSSSTPPSTSNTTTTPLTAIPTTIKKVLRRNKFKSGFDYIRKKKKPTPTPDGTVAPPPPKRVKMSQEKNLTEEDIQLELRSWVLNKGLGETVLHRAARLGYADVAAYSLEHDICSPNCKDNAGYAPLSMTCIKGNLEVAKVLLSYGANPSQAAPGGIRPLHEACENGHVELVRLLIAYGADPLLATYSGQTPLELAEAHEQVKVLLTQHIKDVEGKEEKLWQFRGSGNWAEDPFDNGYDATADPPLPNDISYLDGFEFESSEAPLPPLYVLKGDTPYVLIQDLVNYVGISRDKLLKNHPTAELVELNSNDFLEEAHCCHLLGEKFNLNSSSDLLSLIKYDDRVKKMLNIDSSIIK